LLDTYSIHPGLCVLPSPSPSRRFVDFADLARALVLDQCGELRFRGMLRKVDIVPGSLSIMQRDGTHSTAKPVSSMTVHATRTALQALEAIPTDPAAKWPSIIINWKRVWRWCWSSTRNRHVNDFIYKVIHRRLPIGERRPWDPGLNVGCPCGQDLESMEHLFGVCQVARRVWTWFFRGWRTATGVRLPATSRNVFFASVPGARVRNQDKAYSRLFGIIHPEVLYSIWLARNRWVFDEDLFSARVIAATARARILIACEAAVTLHELPGFIALFDSLYSALEELPG
jgi:hypothetical protein